jgi:hypothetical protein
MKCIIIFITDVTWLWTLVYRVEGIDLRVGMVGVCWVEGIDLRVGMVGVCFRGLKDWKACFWGLEINW